MIKRLLASLALSAVLSNSTIAQVKITFEAPSAYPEGIAWSPASKTFYVSSVKTGTIGKVTMDGKYEVVYEDSTLKSTFGMKVDEQHDMLWVCAGDPNYSIYSSPVTYKKAARIIGISLSTGELKKSIDLASLIAGNHFANDITPDDKGNLYVTDSYSGAIYKIDSAGNSSVFAQNGLFAGKNIGLNGIVYHPQGFLLAAHNTRGALIKIDINDPKKIWVVVMRDFFPGADGLLLDDKGDLVLIQNKGVDKIYKIQSADNWLSATVTAATVVTDRFQNPTTATFADNKVYVLNAKLNEITDKSKNPSKEFSIQQAEFKPAK